jgi:hypothetical protein
VRAAFAIVLLASCSGSSSDGSDGRGGDARPGGDGVASDGDGGAVTCPSDAAYAGPADYEIPYGWFYTQRGCGPGAGFAVIDEADGRFDTFRRLIEVGYPRSSRFAGADGRARQLFDAGMAVADPATGHVWFDDVLARASADENERLAVYGVPPPGSPAGFANSAIEAAWRAGPANAAWCPFSTADAELLFGRPAAPLSMGVQRFDRVLFRDDGQLAELGAALAAVAPEAAAGDATAIPSSALLGIGAPVAPNALGPLRAALEIKADAWAGDVAIAVTDLQTGETIDVNGDRKQTSASSIKWWMITAALAALDDGSASFAMVDIDQPARDILQVSANDDASTIVGLVGGNVINRHMLWQGMTRSTLVQWTPYTNDCYDRPSEDEFFDWNNHLTARDANRSLAALWAGQVLSPTAQAWFIDTGVALTPTEFFGSSFPVPERDIAWTHKVGFIPPDAYGPEDESMSDIGLVYVNDDGFAFALSVLTLHNADHFATEDFIADVGLDVFDYLDAMY